MPPLNHLNESEVAQWQDKLVHALLDLRDGRTTFIEGVRAVLALANESRVRDGEFDLFVAIDSETDHLPSERARESCSPEWLAMCDDEANQVHAFYGAAVQAQVEALLVKFRSTSFVRPGS